MKRDENSTSYSLLEIKNLTLLKQGNKIIDNVSFEIYPGEIFVLLGESGSGKTVTALSVLRLLPESIYPSKESALFFAGKDLLEYSEISMRCYRGRDIGMIFQEPMTSFNPVLTIGAQIEEALTINNTRDTTQSLSSQSYQLLRKVQISDPERVYRSYPHQLSGGMKQRAMIAMALAGKPKLLIADEPTTALDVTTQVEMLKLLKELQKTENIAILFITHDIAVASEMADRIGIMRSGKILETNTVKQFILSPKETYTRYLLSVKPNLQIEPLESDDDYILQVKNLNIRFPIEKGIFRRTKAYIHAVNDVSFTIQPGETVALVGETGSGKSTLAKAIMGLLTIHSGSVMVGTRDICKLKKNKLKNLRFDFQMIFQDPFASLNPRMLIKDILKEGMYAQNIGNDETEREERIDELLRQVEIDSAYKNRYPYEFSGGQRQRICIARALAVGPRLLICDEPTSSLDASVEAKILDLLIHLQNDLGLSYLFITHSFKVVRLIAHNVAVMQAGRIVEYGLTERVLNYPKHDYTKQLLMAEPKIKQFV